MYPVADHVLRRDAWPIRTTGFPNLACGDLVDALEKHSWADISIYDSVKSHLQKPSDGLIVFRDNNAAAGLRFKKPGYSAGICKQRRGCKNDAARRSFYYAHHSVGFAALCNDANIFLRGQRAGKTYP